MAYKGSEKEYLGPEPNLSLSLAFLTPKSAGRWIGLALSGFGIFGNAVSAQDASQSSSSAFVTQTNTSLSYSPSLPILMEKVCERDPHIPHILQGMNEEWRKLPKDMFLAPYSSPTDIPIAVLALPTTMERKARELIAHSFQVKNEAATGKPFDSTNLFPLIGAIADTKVPRSGLILTLIDTFRPHGTDAKEMLDRKNAALADPFSQPFGSTPAETASNK